MNRGVMQNNLCACLGRKQSGWRSQVPRPLGRSVLWTGGWSSVN